MYKSKLKHKGLLFVAIALIIAMATTFYIANLTNYNYKKAVNTLSQTKNKKEKKDKIINDKAIKSLVKELERNKKKYHLQKTQKEDIERIAKEYLRKRYIYNGISSKNAKKITESIKEFCDSNFVNQLKEKLINTSVGNGGVKEKENHTCNINEIYISDIKVADKASGNPDKTDLVYLCDAYADILIDEIPTIAHITLKNTKNNNWTIIDEYIEGQQLNI